MRTVLVVDDEADIIELVRYNLEKEGFRVVEALNGEDALEAAHRSPPDAIVLDLMLPGLDGLEVLRRLRSDEATAEVPILVLSAKSTETDRIVGLEVGADDYLVKPFSPRELVARVKTVLRRTQRTAERPAVVRRGPIAIDAGRREVLAGERVVPLTTTEFNLLRFMAERPGRALTRNELIDGALGPDAMVTDRTIDAHVAAVRRKLGAAAAKWIETIRGYGYRFKDG